MEPIISFTNPFSILTATVIIILVLLLGKETKKSIFPAIMLGVFTIIIVCHTVEFNMLTKELIEIQSKVAFSISMDFIFIFLSFATYLLIDELERIKKKTKSIDNSLNWLWSKI